MRCGQNVESATFDYFGNIGFTDTMASLDDFLVKMKPINSFKD